MAEESPQPFSFGEYYEGNGKIVKKGAVEYEKASDNDCFFVCQCISGAC